MARVMRDWNWTPRAYRLADNVIFYGSGVSIVGIIVWMFILGTN